MGVDRFMPHLEAADSVLDLARRLGAVCLDGERDLAEMRGQQASARELRRLETLIGATSVEVWEEVIAKPRLLDGRLGAEVMQSLRLTAARHPLDCLGVLRGLCRRAVAELFEQADGQIGLDRGMPLPFVTRPLPAAGGGGWTTRLETLHNADLLAPLPFDLFDSPAGGQVRVVLDFAHRDRLDELTWDDRDGLPRIATIHPPGGGDLDFTTEAGRFFNVRPRSWESDEIKRLLQEATKAGAKLAVLPELSLPTPDALDQVIKEGAADLPPIIVAGSAHVEEPNGTSTPTRANESRLYMDGKVVALARKHKAFESADLVEGETLREDLSPGQTTIMVLSGRRTRLAVAICADLQETTIPQLLVAAGVNLLLVPAMTKRIGSFNAPVCDIASYCQGVAVIVNTRWGDDGAPFLTFCGVPREAPAQQSDAFAAAGEAMTSVGLFDPNLPLPEAMTWVAP
jgi:hypothetical protein